MKIEKAESAIGYTFKDKNLLKRALTLSSASADGNNERLEFFGDAILEFIVSERIFREEATEGALTERRKTLVADEALKPVSERLGLDKLLIRGKNDCFNKKAIPSAYEAVIAAIYLDGGLDEAKKFVLSTLDFSPAEKVVNYKGKLQELLQSNGSPCPEYSHRDIGTQERHRFVSEVCAFGLKFTGEADNIKSADRLAAKSALEYFENK